MVGKGEYNGHFVVVFEGMEVSREGVGKLKF
jgi:hypothetical protein